MVRGDADFMGRHTTISEAGARITHLIERWKRGVFLMLALALCAVGSTVVVGIPMAIIGAALSSPAWSRWQAIATVAMIFALPFYLTADAFLDMLDGIVRRERGDRRMERQRR